MRKKIVIVSTVFILILALAFTGCTGLFTSDRNYYTIEEKYLENLNVAQVVANNTITGAVRIITRLKHSNEQSAGAGFIINDGGYIITNEHVIRLENAQSENDYDYWIEFVDGTNSSANYVASDKDRDLGILKIDSIAAADNKCPFLTFTNDPLTFGQSIYTIGNPNNLGITFSGGRVANPSVSISTLTHDIILLDMNVNHGNSGGVLLNSNGAVVGVISSRIESDVPSSTSNGVYVNDVYGIGIAIPTSVVLKYLDEVIVSYTMYSPVKAVANGDEQKAIEEDSNDGPKMEENE